MVLWKVLEMYAFSFYSTEYEKLIIDKYLIVSRRELLKLFSVNKLAHCFCKRIVFKSK